MNYCEYGLTGMLRTLVDWVMTNVSAWAIKDCRPSPPPVVRCCATTRALDQCDVTCAVTGWPPHDGDGLPCLPTGVLSAAHSLPLYPCHSLGARFAAGTGSTLRLWLRGGQRRDGGWRMRGQRSRLRGVPPVVPLPGCKPQPWSWEGNDAMRCGAHGGRSMLGEGGWLRGVPPVVSFSLPCLSASP